MFCRQILTLSIMVVSYITIASEPTTFTYRSDQDANDERARYQVALLKLALEKTSDEYGDFRLISGGAMNNSRALESLKNGSRENYFLKLSFSNDYPSYMTYVPFPIDLGVVGNRICFISPDAKKMLPQKPNLQDLLKLTHVQGKYWIDTEVLKHAGFVVKEVSDYEGKFRMVASNRFDLFCRGINEIYKESEKFTYIPNLDYDKTFMLVYPLPRFFYTHKKNKIAIERVTKGLSLAYEDGSLMKLWNVAYKKSVDAAYIEGRTIIFLENPKVKGINFDFKKYFYKPRGRTKTVTDQGLSP